MSTKSLIGFVILTLAFVIPGCGDDDSPPSGSSGRDGGGAADDGGTSGDDDGGGTNGDDDGGTSGDDDGGGTNGDDDGGTNGGSDAGPGGNDASMMPPRMVTCSGTEQCTADDCMVITTEDVIGFVETCGFSCGNQDDVDTCAEGCLTDMISPSTLTEGCSSCFVDTIECAVENCATVCLSGGPTACDACLCTNGCISDLNSCGGVDDGRCMAM